MRDCPNTVLTAFCKKMGGLTIPLFEVKILPGTVYINTLYGKCLIFTLFYKFPAAIAPFRYFSITAVIYSNFASCKNFEIYPN